MIARFYILSYYFNSVILYLISTHKRGYEIINKQIIVNYKIDRSIVNGCIRVI